MSFSPAFAYLLPTGRCNLNCAGCYATLEEFGRNTRVGELTIEEYRQVVRELYEMGVRTFDISGGEPMLYRDLPALCETIKQYEGTKVWLVTNGTANTVDRLRLLETVVDRLVFSLDAPAPTLHDQLRGSHGAFTKTVEMIRAARGMRFREIALNFVVSRANIATAGEMLQFASQHADRLAFLTFRDVSENGVMYNLIPRLAELREMWQVIATTLAGSPAPKFIDLVSPAFLFPETTAFRRSLPPHIRNRIELHHPYLRGHSPFRETIVVKPFGALCGDTAMVNDAMFEVGSARDGVAKVWAAQSGNWRARLAERQTLLRAQGPCRDCSRWHVCRGGCPAAAVHQWADLMKHDRSCEAFRDNKDF